MKTTLNLPDHLVQTIKLRAVHNKKTLQDTISELLTLGLACSEQAPISEFKKVKFPLVRCGKNASQLSPEELNQVLADEDFRALT